LDSPLQCDGFVLFCSLNKALYRVTDTTQSVPVSLTSRCSSHHCCFVVRSPGFSYRPGQIC
jgi:hypothetical protein